MIKRCYYISVFALSWVLFGICAVVVNFTCAVLLCLPGASRFAPAARELVRRFFSLWNVWLGFTGLVRIRWHGFDDIPLRGGAVWVANHPGLLDATFLLSRLPDAVCAFKPTMRRNPFLAPTALLAGHLACETGTEFIRSAVDRVASGRTLLIFPEGTRTSAHRALNPCKTGFAVIAARAQAPIQIVVIRASRDLLPRGRRWWQVPHFPAVVDIHADDRLDPEPHRSARAIAAFVEERLTEQLAGSPCLVS